MAKLVKIDDRKFMEIFSGLKTMGPVELRLDEAVIGRLLRSVNPPKNIYALNTKNHTQRVSLTLENYMTPENELFDEAKHCFKTAIDAITGKLGKKNLQEQENYFINARAASDKSLVEAERKWIELFNPLVKETIEFEKQAKQN